MEPSFKKYEWVNALRGYSILLVILIHTSLFFYSSPFVHHIAMSGDMGVQLFFIMSSFTLFNSYSKRKQTEVEKVKRNFYIRRFFRIAPYYYIAAIIYTLVAIFIKKEHISILGLLSNITFTNGLYLPGINYIPPGGWSIGVEMLFYLTVPALYNKITSLKKAVLALIISITISNIVNFFSKIVVLDILHKDWAQLRGWELYFWFPNQFPIFIFGIVLFFIFKNMTVTPRAGLVLICTSIFCFFYLAFFKFESDYPMYFFQREYVYPLIFIMFSVGLYSTKSTILSPRFLQNIGTVSFSMYLNHFLVLLFVTKLTNKLFKFLSSFNINESLIKNDILFVLLYIFIVFITYKISCITFKFVEKRGIQFGEKIILAQYHNKIIKLYNNTRMLAEFKKNILPHGKKASSPLESEKS